MEVGWKPGVHLAQAHLHVRCTRFTELFPVVVSFDPQNTAERIRFPSVRRERLRDTEGQNGDEVAGPRL